MSKFMNRTMERSFAAVNETDSFFRRTFGTAFGATGSCPNSMIDAVERLEGLHGFEHAAHSWDFVCAEQVSFAERREHGKK